MKLFALSSEELLKLGICGALEVYKRNLFTHETPGSSSNSFNRLSPNIHMHIIWLFSVHFLKA